MKTLNYLLTTGNNNNLITRKAKGSTMLFQVWYTGVVAANVSVEAWISTQQAGPFAKMTGVSKTLVGAENTAFISIPDLNQSYIQFRLVVPTAGTAGTITNVDVVV